MPHPQDNARFLAVIVILLYLTSSPDSTPLISSPGIVQTRLKRQRAAHGILNTTQWGDFAPSARDSPDGTAKFLNLTGFREEDSYAWKDLGRFRDRCIEFSHNANPSKRLAETATTSAAAAASSLGSKDKEEWDWDLARALPTWQNITGIVHGHWVRRDSSEMRSSADYNLTQLAPSIGWAGSEWSRNITGHEGKMLLRLEDKEPKRSKHPTSAELPDVEAAGHIRTGGLVREVAATASIEDTTGSGGTLDVRLYGVHWPRQGAMLLTTTSDKFAGIFALPHLAPGLNFFRSSQRLLNASTEEVLRRKEKSRFGDVSNPWSASQNMPQEMWNPSPHCEYVMWLQVHPLDPSQVRIASPAQDQHQPLSFDQQLDYTNTALAAYIDQIERELRFPTGAPLPAGSITLTSATVPDLRISSVVWSPDCAFFLESKGPPDFAAVDAADARTQLHLIGMKEEVFEHTAKMWILAYALIMFGQVQLLKTQMRESSTPSTVARVSFWTAAMMMLADGIIFGVSSFWSLSADSTFLPSLMLTFAGLVSMVIGGFFLYEVYKVQEPERRNSERGRGAASHAAAPAANAAPPASSAPATAAGLPRPPVAPAPTPSVIIPSDQDIDAEIAEQAAAVPPSAPITAGGSLLPTTNPAAAPAAANAVLQGPTPFSTILGRFILVGLGLLFTSLAATAWWPPVRSAYMNMLLFVYLSLWIPQIVRNVRRNSHRAFSWRFMLGQSALRLLPVAYFYLCDPNIVFGRTDWDAFAVLAGWVWCQLWALAFQDVLGPRFLLPKGWAPEAWDYHPILREDALEAGGLPIGLMGEAGSGGGGRRSSSESRDSGKSGSSKHTRLRTIDCVICREALEVPVVRAGHSDPTAGGVAGVLARRQYMVTPCRHIFHTTCLEGWLRFRLQCPICRDDLPAL